MILGKSYIAAALMLVTGGSDMTTQIKIVLDQYIEEIKRIIGSDVRNIILYGSYARGDYKSDSDIDLMILVSCSEDKAVDLQNKLFDVSYDFWYQYDLEINPIVKNKSHFIRWVENYPFYNNVQKEGINLYAA